VSIGLCHMLLCVTVSDDEMNIWKSAGIINLWGQGSNKQMLFQLQIYIVSNKMKRRF
jgi:hypothetical protein